PTPPRGPILLQAARDAVEAAVLDRPPRPSPDESRAFARVPGAAFVTLRRRDGSLRGCIGELAARRPLIASVRDCAAGAALRDPRFSPVEPHELEGLRYGVSVLSAPRPASPEDVVVGRHGVVLELGAHRGVLLPEVPVEAGWDRARFLAGIAEKAGLPPDAWQRPEARLSVFESEKFEPAPPRSGADGGVDFEER
ncbi:MAG: AmmeMemoRadiSam system protein A, partial [Sandaracinaceae bacterium]